MPVRMPCVSGTKGDISRILLPMQYRGTGGPGTLVITVLTERCGSRCMTRATSRVIVPTIMGGARFHLGEPGPRFGHVGAFELADPRMGCCKPRTWVGQPDR